MAFKKEHFNVMDMSNDHQLEINIIKTKIINLLEKENTLLVLNSIYHTLKTEEYINTKLIDEE